MNKDSGAENLLGRLFTFGLGIGIAWLFHSLGDFTWDRSLELTILLMTSIILWRQK